MNHKGVGGEVQDVVLGGMKTCDANPQETSFVFSDGCMEQLVFLRRRGVPEQEKESGMASGC